MNPYRCYYHPQIEAITKCDNCGKYLCLECKSVYDRIFYGKSYRVSDIRQELCPECYEKKESYHYLFGIIFLAIFIVVAILMFSTFQNFVNNMNNNNPFFP